MKRLIDADALREQWLCLEGNDFKASDFVYSIDEQPTVDAEPHWIPCSERIPEDGTYIVYAPEYRGGSSRSKEHHNGVMFAAFKSGKWSIEHGYYSRPNCVIAWMPLPKPYEVEE